MNIYIYDVFLGAMNKMVRPSPVRAAENRAGDALNVPRIKKKNRRNLARTRQKAVRL